MLHHAGISLKYFRLFVKFQIFVQMASCSVSSPSDRGSCANLPPITPCGVVVAIAKANSSGITSVIYVIKLDKNECIEGDPFRLCQRNGRYIWPNEILTRERIRFGSVLKYREFGDLFIYNGNTKKRMNVDQIQMALDYGESVYNSIKEKCPDALFGPQKGIYLESKPENPRVFLVTLKYGVIMNERLIFHTKGDSQSADLKLNCRENLSLSTSPVYLQLRPVRDDDDDVGDVALIRFDTTECGLRTPIYPAVCEGLILKHKPQIISTDEEPVKIQNGEKIYIYVPGSVKFDTGNEVATAISTDLVEKLDLEPDRTKRMRLVVAGGSVLDCYTVKIKLRIRGHMFKLNAPVGAVAPGTDLLIGQDIIKKLNDENFSLGE